MGNTLGRYVLREVATAWLLVTGVLLVILLVNQMVGVLERAAASQYPEGVVLELIGLGALQNLSILLPVGLLLGVVLAFGRLYHDSEMAAALACGAGPANIYLPVAALAARARHELSTDGLTHILTLYDGERFEGVPGQREFRIMRFAEHVVPVKVQLSVDATRALEAEPTASLIDSGDPDARAELHSRIAMPLMCAVLALLAVPLSRLRPRQGRYARVWVAVVIFFLYVNLITVGKVWIARGAIPEILGLWWTHAVVVLVALGVIVGPGLAYRLRYRIRGL